VKLAAAVYKTRMSKHLLHQVIVGSMPGDAITDQAFLIRRWLREMGFVSEIFAEFVHPALENEIRPFATYQPKPSEKWLIFHHSIGSSIADRLITMPLELILIYHNVTPPEFLIDVDPALALELEKGKRQLNALCNRTALALADSSFNEQDLRDAGHARTGVLPITLDEKNYTLPSNKELLARFNEGGTRLLFVGRLVPNKKQDDLIRLLCFYKQIEPAARLLLVGDPWVPTYARYLRELAARLGLCESVFFAGHVTQQDLVTYFKLADVYVSMSEHEGFGKPLIESMYLGLPVLAFAETAVSGTLGDAGVLFHEKNFAVVAEMAHLLVREKELRTKIIARQRERVRSFAEPTVQRIWRMHLQSLMGVV
jgi:L-malate glycosyltransferase